MAPRRPSLPPPPVESSDVDAGTEAPLESFKRPGVVTTLAVLDLIGGAFSLILVAAMLATLGSGNETDAVVMVVVAGLYAVVGLASLVAGVGLLKLRRYGRLTQFVLSCIGLLAFPLGTIISVLILIYLSKPGVKLLFSERDPADLDASERAQVAAAASSGAMVAVVAIVCIVGAVCVVGIIAAIAIPSLLRARVAANEAGAIAQLRTVLSAEVAYASVNSGFFDKVECLSAPADCIPGYAADRGPMLTEAATAVNRGYNFTFHPGPPSAPEGGRASPTSVQRFAYVAVPVAPNRTGVRSFCVDASGRVCATAGGVSLVPEDAACPASCQTLP